MLLLCIRSLYPEFCSLPRPPGATEPRARTDQRDLGRNLPGPVARADGPAAQRTSSGPCRQAWGSGRHDKATGGDSVRARSTQVRECCPLTHSSIVNFSLRRLSIHLPAMPGSIRQNASPLSAPSCVTFA